MKVGFRNPKYLPSYAHEGDAGADIRAVLDEDIVIPPHEWVAVPTGLYAEIPVGWEIQIRPRSGLALRKGITVLNSVGTVDSNYRGEIKVILVNHSGESFRVQDGDRVAQMVVAPVTQAEFVEVGELSDTDRSSGGFGSTGVK